MSDSATITETCICGATLRITAWPPHALSARREFAGEHAACRSRSEVDPIDPFRGAYVALAYPVITLCGEEPS